MKVNNDDKALLKGLVKVLQEGTFPLKVKEVAAFAKVYQWVLNLEERFEEKEEKEEIKEINSLEPMVESATKKKRKKKE